MAKVSSFEKNAKRARLIKKYAKKRADLKVKIKDSKISDEERFAAVLELEALPKNSSKVRYRNRCRLTGRPRGNYRLFGLSRIAFRELASEGQIPGIVKSSW
ncbi:MAG: 30S ribosomal protein S14 [Alphaproteobacteria bacterium CG11_big_fil_rev_8_21_14_0_20_44_7]|nr:MAG: 30S ribosomal protein S14 [Alphaproteobacteria bacterium CG11_big_fil_rev_8_21_14_0_20_44_7]